MRINKTSYYAKSGVSAVFLCLLLVPSAAYPDRGAKMTWESIEQISDIPQQVVNFNYHFETEGAEVLRLPNQSYYKLLGKKSKNKLGYCSYLSLTLVYSEGIVKYRNPVGSPSVDRYFSIDNDCAKASYIKLSYVPDDVAAYFLSKLTITLSEFDKYKGAVLDQENSNEQYLLNDYNIFKKSKITEMYVDSAKLASYDSSSYCISFEVNSDLTKSICFKFTRDADVKITKIIESKK